MSSLRANRAAQAACFFLLTATVVWIVYGRRIALVGDEGIYLAGAVRVINGEAPYRDFFVFTGPGTFWALAGLFQLFGTTTGAARILFALDLGILAGCVYWLTARLVRTGAAIAAWLLFVVFTTADSNVVGVSHRWDSAALATLAGLLLFHALESGRKIGYFAAGALAAAAAWCTPSLLVAVAALGAWLLFQKEKAVLRLFIAGAAIVSAPCLLALAWQSALFPMIDHMLWASANYSGPNRMPYGSIVVGYRQILAGASGAELAARVAILTILALPAVLPVAALILMAAGARSARNEWVLGTAMIAIVLSAYPRMDVRHLTYTSALPYALATALAFRRFPPRAFMSILTPLVVMAGLFLVYGVQSRPGGSMETRAGNVSGNARELAAVSAWQTHVRPGDSLFAFPYFPTANFLLGAPNPSRYIFLQPGMMSRDDEARALADLERSTPKWILYADVPAENYLRTWPASDRSRLRMASIEGFIKKRYSVVVPKDPQVGLLLLGLRSPAHE